MNGFRKIFPIFLSHYATFFAKIAERKVVPFDEFYYQLKLMHLFQKHPVCNTMLNRICIKCRYHGGQKILVQYVSAKTPILIELSFGSVYSNILYQYFLTAIVHEVHVISQCIIKLVLKLMILRGLWQNYTRDI
jgi:hypothetical protein